MSKIDQVFKTKDDRSVEIIEGNFPDKVVKDFLNCLDDEGKESFRHEPNSENEFQYFAVDHMGNRGNRIVAYGAVYPRDKEVGEACLAIAVDAEWRGCGLGKFMYQIADQVAANNGKSHFRAETDSNNEKAVRIMRSLGWELYGPIYIVKKFFTGKK